ncbi:RelA/SpoT family protein [Thiovibrio frasassiensis]|uniref:Bifunctional (P)ppGpp synthetase/guanosine-3',5'-bis(Diphosphate) 3'-pyrophosphohydrolase n=1 Tax=Thiovibrio frasassiensis TaxID=2984131 RepID=A0A9X4MGK1_9BACT|nr:bifunctional (p)ppGpp synthetase/guanosine-3',5'-bis(diphosphate) 3'-pyrophosphohydrolase [Thiovibrio frasassiensis]MDG4476232.1 bifunctional (p)ppGpp synthetase/guanosine-3',5'-bis(diphosphate) 3'-pyrophosphohydrolase [Thiovibrio frasassiensis]
MVTIESISERARGYMPEEDLALLTKAHAFADEFYSGKHRLSGRPYLYHALMVTDILATMRLDVPTLCAGLLHGVLKKAENLKETEKTLRETFGDDVTNIVKGATKITDVQFNSHLAYQAENIRKLLLAMSSDIRVLLVKLADRLHDMHSLQHVGREKQLEFAQETMELYAPLASRLGIDWLKRELEDLAFANLHPEEYEDLAAKVHTSLADRETYVDEVKALLNQKLSEHGLKQFRVLGRPKHLYSIYKKLVAQNIPFERVYDKVAFRIIVPSVKECYEALGIIHSLWPPVDGRFKDFISTPKGNMYQSLHTSVVGLRGEFMEVQIRTEEMDQIAKEGIAAHWAYKEGKAITTKDAKLFKWLKQLVYTLQELEDPKEFLDAIKGELYEEEIFVLTPTGEVKEFPKGSTPIDFAYSIHTEVGNHCTGAKINGIIAQLKTQLKNGDLVEIHTSPKQKPNRSWLGLVKTARAKSRIRQWLNQEERERTLHVGREICERELKRHNISLKKLIKTGHLKELLKNIACNSLDDLMRRIGSGKMMVQALIKELQPEEIRETLPEDIVQEAAHPRGGRKQDRDNIILVSGADNVLTKISHCCMPVPGDEIVGFITSGRGISVHKASCPNLSASDQQRLIAVNWAENIKATHRAQIQVIARDQKGLLATLSNAISHDDANILTLEATTSSGGIAKISIILEINSRDHLFRLLQHVQQLDGVLEARRT